MKKDEIKAIVEIFEASNLVKMEVASEGLRILMEKADTNRTTPTALPAVTLDQKVDSPKKAEKHSYWVKAPIVGTFYQSRTPKGAPFIEIGQRVKQGDVLCIIEAMKVMNEIHSPVDGVVQEILLTQESMVEYDQQLIRIGTDS